MKKILSLILAILMIASTVPMAFAVEFDKNAYTKALIDAYSAAYNVYKSDSSSTSINKTTANLFYLGSIENEVFAMYPALQAARLDTEKLATMPEAANAYTTALEAALSGFPARSTSIQINTRKLFESMYGVVLKYGETKLKNFSNKVPAELTANAKTSLQNALVMLTSEKSHTYSQSDFDATIKDAVTYFTQSDNCLSGKHNMENNTVFADNGNGTHTFTCAFCAELTTVEHSYADGKCVCGVEKTVADDNKDNENKTDTEDKTDNNNQKPEKTNFIKELVQRISNFFKELLEKMRELFKG